MKNKIKKFNRNNIVNIIITLVFALIAYYFVLPPINLSAPAFWTFMFIVYGFYLLLSFTSLVGFASGNGNVNTLKLSKGFKIMLSIIPIGIGLILIINFILSPLFNSKSYASRIKINEGKDFATEVKPVDFSRVPLLDKESTQKIGDRVMGEMTDLVSQFTVSNLYTQINYKDSIVRVTPLEYAGLIKYFTNRDEGITGYILVDSTNGKANLVRLEKGMKYMPSAIFNENLTRKLRFSYPTEIFGDYSFELDEEGNPYWIVTTIKYSGVGLKEEISGAIIFNPITGESKKYDVEEIPSWVDHVYNANLILSQVNDWGLYNGGYWNSIFGQKNVVATTTGYNYVAQDDDIYLYTGITSVASDESNLGFILTNMRTKETNYYLIPGAEEYSAMASAEGQVQQMKYNATFPLLINLNGKATYLISLKDNAGLVKMYAFVDVQNYQKVVVTDANEGIIKAKDNYLKNNNQINNETSLESEVIIKNIYTVMIDGNTYYYFSDNQDKKYRVSIKINEQVLPFIKIGDKVKIKYVQLENINEITNLNF
ncbi:MAG: hypothetical protein J6A52_00665 [Bacilli bacterium]|nr:hypothetical protein [Bacilli bacterium]